MSYRSLIFRVGNKLRRNYSGISAAGRNHFCKLCKNKIAFAFIPHIACRKNNQRVISAGLVSVRKTGISAGFRIKLIDKLFRNALHFKVMIIKYMAVTVRNCTAYLIFIRFVRKINVNIGVLRKIFRIRIAPLKK